MFNNKSWLNDGTSAQCSIYHFQKGRDTTYAVWNDHQDKLSEKGKCKIMGVIS
jgi:hypothetical protein